LYLEVQWFGSCKICSDIHYLSSEVEEVGNKSQEKKDTNLGWDIWLEKERRDLKDFSFHGSTALGA
jgi:hypothetical protein